MNHYFAENIKSLRMKKEMTQETLATFLSVSPQAVSKWERGASMPDIIMLPAIASFFGVTTDYLLGVDKIKSEERIQEYINGYYADFSAGRIDKIKDDLRCAMREFPGEYRIIVRYLNVLTAECDKDPLVGAENKNEAVSIYDNIQSFCTTDSIRIWAKKLMCRYYRNLSGVPGSGVTMEDAKAILETLPLMQNGRDYYAAFFYPAGEERLAACRSAVSSLAAMLNDVVSAMAECDLAPEEKAAAVSTAISATDCIYPDGDYGQNFIPMIRAHANTGKWYLELGNRDKAAYHLMECARLAARFDEAEEDSVCTSPLVQGVVVSKSRLRGGGSSQQENAADFIANLPSTSTLDNYSEIMEILRK